MPKVYSVLQALDLDVGDSIPILKGYINKKFERTVGTGKFGKYSYETVVLGDADDERTEIKVTFKNRPPIKFEEGDLIWIIAEDGDDEAIRKEKNKGYDECIAVLKSATVADSDVSGERHHRRQDEPEERRGGRTRHREESSHREEGGGRSLTTKQRMFQVANFWLACNRLAHMAAADMGEDQYPHGTTEETIVALTTSIFMNTKHPKVLDSMEANKLVVNTSAASAKVQRPDPEPEPELEPEQETEPEHESGLSSNAGPDELF